MKLWMKICLVVLGMALMFGTGYGVAQNTAQRPDACSRRFAVLDADRDGKVARDEFMADAEKVANQQFRKMDANGDGIVTFEELCNFFKANQQKRCQECKQNQ
jgi:Ca2+-binding EF-hand superfamily protein